MGFHPPKSPEPVRSGIFTYDKHGIKAGGFSREPVSELQLYGIPFKKSESAIQLKAALEAAVASGKCNSLAPSITAVEKSLSEQYKYLLKIHSEEVDRLRTDEFSQQQSPTEEANFDPDRFMAKYFLDGFHGQPAPNKTKEALILGSVDKSAFEMAVRGIPGLATHISARMTVVGWEPTIQRGLDEAFVKLLDCGLHIPTAEANFDLDRFLAKYFVGLDGKSAPRKTPDPITLCTFFEHQGRLRTAVASIPGLHLCEANDMYGVTTIIDWDVDKVKLQKSEIEAETAKQKAACAAEAQAAKEEKRWHALQPHREYMKNHQVTTAPLNLDNLTGSFIVHCEKTEDYSHLWEVMALDIAQPYNAHGTMAAFDFGLVKGTMLLALSNDALHLLRQEVKVIADKEESEEAELDYWEFDGYGSSRKRKAEGTQTTQTPIKRRLEESPKPNRVYLQWAGREDKHIGYLDFDASKASAQGVFAHPSFFGDVQIAFAIYKTMDQPCKISDSWSRFTQKQHDYECRARWH